LGNPRYIIRLFTITFRRRSFTSGLQTKIFYISKILCSTSEEVEQKKDERAEANAQK